MDVKTLFNFTDISEVLLESISGGDRSGYCDALITGRIVRKHFLKQPITRADFICN